MIRFGQQLGLWLDFLGMRQNELADETKWAATYVSAIMRGQEAGGIDRPSEPNQKKVFKALTAKWGKKVDRDVFWQGPPALTNQTLSPSTNELDQILKVASLDGKRLTPEEQEEVLRYATFVRGHSKTNGSRR